MRRVVPVGTAITQTPVIQNRLKAAEPTIVPGPRSPARNPLPTISITESRISGALEPRAISVRFATVSFHICQHQKHKQNPLRYKYKCSNFRSRVDPETRKLYFISIRQVSLTVDFWYFATY